MVVADPGQLDLRDNFHAMAPKRVIPVIQNSVGIATHDDFKDTVVVVPGRPPGIVQHHHADDFIALTQVDLGDFALAAAHRACVDYIALSDELGHLLGEEAVEISSVHMDTSFLI